MKEFFSILPPVKRIEKVEKSKNKEYKVNKFIKNISFEFLTMVYIFLITLNLSKNTNILIVLKLIKIFKFLKSISSLPIVSLLFATTIITYMVQIINIIFII